MGLFLVFLCVFLAVLIAGDALVRWLRDRLAARHYVNQRVRLIEQDADRKAVYGRMLRERRYTELEDGSAGAYFTRLYTQSGVNDHGVRNGIYALLSGVLAFAIANRFLEALALVALIIGVAVAVFVFWFAFHFRRQRRQRSFIRQFPEALDVIVRSLSAGHPLPVSIALVAREMPDPIGTEFGLLSDELTYGKDLDAAVRNMYARVGLEEINLLAISLTVQKGTGGNLAEILANLADIIRRRTMMKAKIRAISAEGRMTSWFMLLFPFGLYGLIKLLHAEYFDPLWESGYGNVFLSVAGAMLIFGMLILRKIVNFDY